MIECKSMFFSEKLVAYTSKYWKKFSIGSSKIDEAVIRSIEMSEYIYFLNLD